MGGAKTDLKTFPDEVQDVMGYALDFAQQGKKHPDAKPLKGFGGAGVLEIVDDFDGNTYRAVYTVKFADAVYVLHCFQKKSKHGIATPQQDIELVERRLKRAREHYSEWKADQKENKP
jgi:phage-related protein